LGFADLAAHLAGSVSVSLPSLRRWVYFFSQESTLRPHYGYVYIVTKYKYKERRVPFRSWRGVLGDFLYSNWVVKIHRIGTPGVLSLLEKLSQKAVVVVGVSAVAGKLFRWV
jgi:hypothetical protein